MNEVNKAPVDMPVDEVCEETVKETTNKEGGDE